MAKKVYTYNPNKLQGGGSAPVPNPWQDYVNTNQGAWNSYNAALNQNQQVQNEIVNQAEIRDKKDDDWNIYNSDSLFGQQYNNLINEIRPDVDWNEETNQYFYTDPFTNPSQMFLDNQDMSVHDWMKQNYSNAVESPVHFPTGPGTLFPDKNVQGKKTGHGAAVHGPTGLNYDGDIIKKELAGIQAFENFAASKTKPELRQAMKNLPPEIQDFMSYDESGLYNVALLGNDPVNFPKQYDGTDMSPERGLYCTPAGCNVANNALTELGLPNIPTFYNNNAFVKYMGGPNSPFEVVSNPQPGDMVSNYGMAPTDYATNPTEIYRPHHTGIVESAGARTFDKTGTDEEGNNTYGYVNTEGNYYDPYRNELADSKGIPVPEGEYESGVGYHESASDPYLNMYQARGGDQFNFGADEVSLYTEDPIFYRYVGETPGMKTNLLTGLEENIQYAPQNIQDAYNAEGANQMDIFNMIYNSNNASAPVGTPSRASMITGDTLPIKGQYQMGGMLMNNDWMGFPMGEGDPTIKSGPGLQIPGIGSAAQKISIKSPRHFKKGGKVPQMQGGGLLKDWWERQNWGGGTKQKRQDFRLGNMQDRFIQNNPNFAPGAAYDLAAMNLPQVSGRDAIKQQRLIQKATRLGIAPEDWGKTPQYQAGGQAAPTQAQIKAARQAKNAKFSSAASPIVGAIGDIAPGMVAANSQTSPSGETVDVGNAALSSGLGMAAQGAQMGMAFGPWGAAIGAAAGAIGGAFFGKSQAEKKQKEIIENKEKKIASNLATGLQQNQVNSAKVLSQYPTQGLDDVSYFAKFGGMMAAPEYQVEGGEVMLAPENNPPKADNHGNVQQIGMNMFKFNGDTHDAPSGGIGVQGGNSEFASQTNQVLESGFVFSDRLKPNKDYLLNV